MKYSNPTGLPSVSDIISPCEDQRWYKKEHTDRGNFVHGWAAADLLGLMTPPCPESYSPYIASYLEFKQHITDVHIVEKRLTSKRGYCGQIDLVGGLDSSYNYAIALLDWKTSQAAQKSWSARLGGYTLLLEEHGIAINGAASVRLKSKPTQSTGFYPLVNMMHRQEIKEAQIDFLSMYRVYQNILMDGKIYTTYTKNREDY